jgi:carotenoid phi-ring synthase / carotenoid chi-ring synthase
MIKKIIKKRLNNYIETIETPDKTLTKHLTYDRSVAVIGAGIAGLSSAYHLSKRGFKVDLYEKDDFLGGKLGSWKIKDHLGNDLYTEHGFHAFFRQYLNFRNFLSDLGIDHSFHALDNYSIQMTDREILDFKNISKTPILNILALRKKGLFTFGEMMKNPKLSRLIDLLKYDPVKTFEKYDHISYKDFIAEYKIPKKLEIVFTSFARAFFADPVDISMAELIKSFHFYFLASEHGLDYDVLNDDFHFSILKIVRKKLEQLNVQIITNSEVVSIDGSEKELLINQKKYDYAILSADARSSASILEKSDNLKVNKELYRNIYKLQQKSFYSVLRIWSKQKLELGELPFFIFTDRINVLDSITFYHEMEKSSRDWAEENDAAVYELHSYNVPEEFDKEATKSLLLQDFKHYFTDFDPEQILFEHFQFRNDFSSYGLNLNKIRPSVDTNDKRVLLAGDWVKLPIPVMLMEAAYSSALFAVNKVFSNESLQTETILSVSRKGVLA